MPTDDTVTPLLLRHDVAPLSPAPITASAPPWDSEVSRGDRFSLDRQSPIETSSLDSPDSSLVDSPRWDDSLFHHFLRSPSPESGRSAEDNADEEGQKENGVPEYSRLSSSADAEKVRNDQPTEPPSEKPNRIRIRLRVKPEPPPAPPATKVFLRLPARKRPQKKNRHQRKVRSTCEN